MKKSLKGYVNVRDIDGNSFRVSVKDPKYISGELVFASKQTMQTKECRLIKAKAALGMVTVCDENNKTSKIYISRMEIC